MGNANDGLIDDAKEKKIVNPIKNKEHIEASKDDGTVDRFKK